MQTTCIFIDINLLVLLLRGRDWVQRVWVFHEISLLCPIKYCLQVLALNAIPDSFCCSSEGGQAETIHDENTKKTVRNCQYFLKSGSHSPPDDCFSGFPFKWDTEYDREWNLWVLDKQPKSAQTEQTQGQPQHRRRRSVTAKQLERLRAFPKKMTREINFPTFLKNKS